MKSIRMILLGFILCLGQSAVLAQGNEGVSGTPDPDGGIQNGQPISRQDITSFIISHVANAVRSFVSPSTTLTVYSRTTGHITKFSITNTENSVSATGLINAQVLHKKDSQPSNTMIFANFVAAIFDNNVMTNILFGFLLAK